MKKQLTIQGHRVTFNLVECTYFQATQLLDTFKNWNVHKIRGTELIDVNYLNSGLAIWVDNGNQKIYLGNFTQTKGTL